MRKVIKKLAVIALSAVIAISAVPAQAQAATSKSIIKNNWTSFFGTTSGTWSEGAEGRLTNNSKTGWMAEMDSIGYGGVWGAQVKQENIKFKKGQTYKISFKLNSTNIDKWVLFKIEGEDASAVSPMEAPLFYEWIHLKAGEAKTCTYTFTVGKKYKGHLSLVFGVGGEFGDREDEALEGLYDGLTVLPTDADAAYSTTVICSNFSMKTIDTTVKSVKSTKKATAKVSLKKVAGVKGYIVQYSTKKNFKGAKQVKTTKTSVTIKKLKSKKKYYFRVKTYNSNNVVSDAWSKAKSKKIK